MSVNGKRKGIDKNDLESVAKAMSIKKARPIIDLVNSTVKRWKEFAEAANVSSKKRDEIAATLHVYN